MIDPQAPALAGPLWLPGPHGEEPRGGGAGLAPGARGPVVPVEDSSVLLFLLAGMKEDGGEQGRAGVWGPQSHEWGTQGSVLGQLCPRELIAGSTVHPTGQF